MRPVTADHVAACAALEAVVADPNAFSQHAVAGIARQAIDLINALLERSVNKLDVGDPEMRDAIAGCSWREFEDREVTAIIAAINRTLSKRTFSEGMTP